jgi:hypothetical protein
MRFEGRRRAPVCVEAREDYPNTGLESRFEHLIEGLDGGGCDLRFLIFDEAEKKVSLCPLQCAKLVGEVALD